MSPPSIDLSSSGTRTSLLIWGLLVAPYLAYHIYFYIEPRLGMILYISPRKPLGTRHRTFRALLIWIYLNYLVVPVALWWLHVETLRNRHGATFDLFARGLFLSYLLEVLPLLTYNYTSDSRRLSVADRSLGGRVRAFAGYMVLYVVFCMPIIGLYPITRVDALVR